ncbi:hypothetical protein ABPG72_008636 [Tetrahymena utriculariae]
MNQKQNREIREILIPNEEKSTQIGEQNNLENKDQIEIIKDLGITNQEVIEQKSSEFHATVNLFKGLVGIGILSLPIGFSKSGWLAGLIILPLCGIGMLYLSQQMMSLADKTHSKSKNITEFCSDMLGKRSITFVNVCLFGIQLGVCISYVIFFTSYFKKSFCHTMGETSYSCESRIPSLLVALVILLPCIFIRHMDKLKQWSMSANVFILCSLLIISLYCGYNLKQNGLPEVQQFNFSSMGDSVGIFIFTFEGVGLYFDVRHSMQEPKRFFVVLNYVIYFALILYTSFGILGYLTFGSKVKDIILFNFDLTNPVLFVVQILYCISLILSYPIQIFPCVNLVEHKILKKFCAKQFAILEEERQRKINEVNQYLISETDDKQSQIPQKLPFLQKKKNKAFSFTASSGRERSNSLNNRQIVSAGEQTDDENKLDEIRYRQRHQFYSTFLEQEETMEIQDYDQLSEVFLDEDDESRFLKYSCLVRLGFLAFVFLMAMSIDRISIFINFIGSICGTALCYFIPVMIIYKNESNIPFWKSLVNWFIFLVALACGIFGAYSSVILFAKDFGQDI